MHCRKQMIDSAIGKKYGLLISIGILLLLLFLRVSSHKYSLDTSVLFVVLRNIIFDQSTFNPIGGINQFSAHFSPILILLSPLYFLGPTILIAIWKFFCYGAFLLILWRLIDTEHRHSITNWHKNLFVILVALHPTFILNAISPDIWDSDLILPLLGLSVLFVSRDKYFWSVFWLCLTFLVKEDMMLVGILYGIFLARRAKDVRFIWLSVLSLGWFWITTRYVMPFFSTSGEGLALLKFSFGNLGNSLGEIVVNSVINPHLLIENGFWLRKFASLFIIFACVGFLPFWRKRSLIYLLPGLSVLGYTLIAAQPYLDYSKHYVLAFFVFVVWSSYESYLAIDKDSRSRLVLYSISASGFLVLVLQINIRVWSYYFSPIENLRALESAEREYIPPGSYLFTAGVGSPWTCYKNHCAISAELSPAELETKRHDFVLINLRTIFWEGLSCSDQSLAINLRELNRNQNYRVLTYTDDIVLLVKNRSGDDSRQPDWSARIGKYQKINHDCMKWDLMRKVRLL